MRAHFVKPAKIRLSCLDNSDARLISKEAGFELRPHVEGSGALWKRTTSVTEPSNADNSSKVFVNDVSSLDRPVEPRFAQGRPSAYQDSLSLANQDI